MSLREAAQMALHALEKQRMWNGQGWTFNPLPSRDYLPALEALRDALAEAAGAEAEKAEPVASDDDEVLFVFDADMQGRHWWTGGTWLYPGDSVVVRRAAARGKG